MEKKRAMRKSEQRRACREDKRGEFGGGGFKITTSTINKIKMDFTAVLFLP